MKRLLILAALFGAVVYASELQVRIAQGAGIQTALLAPGGKYSFQCPNIDGGSGERVYYRPGCPTRTDGGANCPIDAGHGDNMVDFAANADPYKVDLATNEDRIHFRNASDPTRVVFCPVFRRNPP